MGRALGGSARAAGGDPSGFGRSHAEPGTPPSGGCGSDPSAFGHSHATESPQLAFIATKKKLPRSWYVFSAVDDIALRCPRRVQRRSSLECQCRSDIRSARYYAGGDGAARHPYPRAKHSPQTASGHWH